MAVKKKKKKGSKIVKVLLMLFLLFVLIVGGFALGVYLQLIDTQEANEQLKLYDLPVIGEYFVRPAPSESDMEKMPVEDAKPDKDKDLKSDDKDKKESKKLVITKEEIEKQQKNENTLLPLSFDYNEIPGLSREVISKLNDFKPETIGKALRISGVTPAAISILLLPRNSPSSSIIMMGILLTDTPESLGFTSKIPMIRKPLFSNRT